MNNEGGIPGSKARPRPDTDLSPSLGPRSRMSRSYTSWPLSACMTSSRTERMFMFISMLPKCIIAYIVCKAYGACYYDNAQSLQSRRLLSNPARRSSLLRIREVPGSNLGPGDRLSWLKIFVFFSVPTGECRYSTLKLRNEPFLPNPFQFIIIHLSPYHRRNIVVFFSWRWGWSDPSVDTCLYASILRIPHMIWVWRERVAWYIDRGKPKNSQKNLSQCHFVHHKSHMDWAGREPGPPRWEAGD
jgi:hypothetical protein